VSCNGTAESIEPLVRLDNRACRLEFLSPVRTPRCNNPSLEGEPVDIGEAEKRAESMEVRTARQPDGNVSVDRWPFSTQEIAGSLKYGLCVFGIRSVCTASIWTKVWTFSSPFSTPTTYCSTLHPGMQITLLHYTQVHLRFQHLNLRFPLSWSSRQNVKEWHCEGGLLFGEITYWTIREVRLARLRQSRAEVERLPTFQQLGGAGVQLNTVIKGGSNGAISSALQTQLTRRTCQTCTSSWTSTSLRMQSG
jgi:hypothetical protein